MMTYIKNNSLGAALFLMVLTAQSQTVAKPYEIGTWEDFRQSAISWTFDDGCSNQFAKAIPLFDKLGFKGTFFTVTSWSPQWTTLKKIASNGHEVASHTVNHYNFNTLNDSLQNIQLKNSQLTINSNIRGISCVTIAYPFCVAGNKTLCSGYYIAARGCQGTIETRTPGDFMNVSSMVCGQEGSQKSFPNFKKTIDNTVTAKGWSIFLIHGIDNDGGYSPLPFTVLDSALSYCKSRNYKCWVNTFGNIARYIRERNTASVTEVASSEMVITLKVTDTLNDSLYNYPISIRRPVPDKWSSLTVTQNGKEVRSLFVKPDSVVYTIFSVVPDGGEVKLVRGTGTIILTDQNYEYPGTDISSQVMIPGNRITPAGGKLTLKYSAGKLHFELPSGCGKSIHLSIVNATGILLANYNMGNLTNHNGSITFQGRNKKPGYYIVRITNGSSSWSQPVCL